MTHPTAFAKKLDFNRLSFFFQKIRVLDNVSFEAKPGDMLALIGTNRK